MENKNQDERDESLNNPEDENQDESLNENLDGDDKQEEKDYRQIAENQKIRAEKAERELKKLKSQKEEKPNNKSNEPDYAKLAYLEQKGVIHPDDQKIVQDEAQRLKMPLTDILSMEHIQSKLKTSKEQREAEEGMPKGRGKSGGKSQGDVDYWLAKGETPEDVELANKVIEARMKNDESSKMFDDIR